MSIALTHSNSVSSSMSDLDPLFDSELFETFEKGTKFVFGEYRSICSNETLSLEREAIYFLELLSDLEGYPAS